MKLCKECLIEKDLQDFYKWRAICKNCCYLLQKDSMKQYQENYKKDNASKIEEYHRNYRQINKEKNANYFKEYFQKNKKEILENNKDYQKEYHKNYDKTKRNKYRKNRKLNDPIYNLSECVRSLINSGFTHTGYKKSSKTIEILGCSFEEFKSYLESKFESWMNWQNKGKYNGKFNYGWDIDHIIPLNSAKTPEEIIKLNHYTNLQPLCSYTNRFIKKNIYNYVNAKI